MQHHQLQSHIIRVNSNTKKMIDKHNRDKYMNSFSYEITQIYLKLKNKEWNDLLKNDKIKNIVEEIQKNQYNDAQLYILAKLLFCLINIDSLNKKQMIYPEEQRFNKNKISKYFMNLFENNFNNRLNNKIQKIVNDIKNDKNIDRIFRFDIILRFIDEYIEVSKEDSEYSKKLQQIIQRFTHDNNNRFKSYIPTIPKPIIINSKKVIINKEITNKHITPTEKKNETK
jgi:hypothetical protein